jgi:hypothetical protein
VQAAGASTFAKATFVSASGHNVDVNDDQFWEKIMPEQLTSTALLMKVQSEPTTYFDTAKSRAQLLKDIGVMVVDVVQVRVRACCVRV